jgi:large repetitive protein
MRLDQLRGHLTLHLRQLRVRRCLAVAALLYLGAFVGVASAQVGYVYDERGRLVQVVGTDGSSAVYDYDAAGNIRSIQRAAASKLTLSEFTPSAGPIGTEVTLLGTGFSPTPGNNTVKFNGVSTPVSSATENRLLTTVPPGATTGSISVTVSGKTVTSSQNYVVGIANPPPSIASFSPAFGLTGTTVTVSGTNFDPDKSRNAITINGRSVAITTSSTTQLTFSIPADVTTGTIRVTTPSGSASSAEYLYVVPAGINAPDITLRGRLQADGTSVPITLLAPQKYAQFAFEVIAGQSLGLGMSDTSHQPNTGTSYPSWYIKTPNGSDLPSSTCKIIADTSSVHEGSACELGPQPVGGTYQLFVRSDSQYTFSSVLTLSTDLSGTLTTTPGTSATFSTLRPGKNGKYTFAAIAGRRYSLAVSGMTIPGRYTQISVFGPDQKQIANDSYAPDSYSGSIDLPPAAAGGTYTVQVDPYKGSTGNLTLILVETLDDAIAIDGLGKVVSMAVGQNARLTFSATAGQKLGLGVSGVTTTPSGRNVDTSVLGPTGATVVDCGGASSLAECDITIPATGSYTIVADQEQDAAATATLTLSTDINGVLKVTDTQPTLFETSRPGQNGRFTFAGTAGGNYGLALTDNTIAGSLTYIRVYGPSGNQLDSAGISIGGTANIDLVNVTDSGTYAVVIDPYQGNVGQLKLALTSARGGGLPIDGAPKAISLAVGQDARLTFNGTTGQTLGLAVSGLSTSPSGGYVEVSVLAPDGRNISSCGRRLNQSCNLTLPGSGLYTVVASPDAGYSASLTLTLSTDLAGSLVLDAADTVTFSTARAGQNGRFAFSATAGDSVSVVVSSVTFSGSQHRVSILSPAGQVLAYRDVTGGSASSLVEALNLPVTGTYTVLVDPYADATGGLALLARRQVAGTLVNDGPGLQANLLSGQRGEYTIQGTAGQRLGLGLSGLTTSPPSSSVAIAIYSPTGETLSAGCSSSTGNQSCNLWLQADGRYRVKVTPGGVSGASFTLTLSSDVVGTLVPNGTSVSFNGSRPGQNGRFTFAGVAGNSYTLNVSNLTATATVRIISPAGDELVNRVLSATTGTVPLAVPRAPGTGSYVVEVDPAQANIVSTVLQVLDNGAVPPDTQTVQGVLPIGGSPLPVSVPSAQIYRYTFDGTLGQRLGLGVSAITTSPAGYNVSVKVYLPDNATLLTDCGARSTAWNCDIDRLPSTGRYTVRVQPYITASANLTLTLSADVVGTITPNAATPTLFSTSRNGQNGRYTFNATAGDYLGITWSEAALTGSANYLRVFRPNGSEMAGNNIGVTESGANDMAVITTTGTHTLLTDVGTGQVKFALAKSDNGAIDIDGSPKVININTAQTGRYQFTGTAGDLLSLALTEVLPASGTTYIRLRSVAEPDLYVDYCTLSNQAADCSFAPLPSDGDYLIQVDPSGTATFGAKLTLSRPTKGTIKADAVNPVSFTSNRPGRNGRYTFNGTAGQRLSVLWSESTLLGSSHLLSVEAPDGAQMGYATFSQVEGSLDVRLLEQTGTYTLVLDPRVSSAGDGTGQIKLRLREAVDQTVSVDGASVAVNLAEAQIGRYTFSGVAGSGYNVTLTNVATIPSGVATSMTVRSPSGSSVPGCSSAATDRFCNLAPLTETGSYVIEINLSTTASITGTLAVSSEITGSVALNAVQPEVFQVQKAGQTGRYQFNASAGDAVSLVWTDVTIVGAFTNITTSSPSGVNLSSANVSSSPPRGVVDLGVLREDGPYTITVDPYQLALGQVRLAVTRIKRSSLQIDSDPVSASLINGQSGSWTFSGQAGQNLGVVLKGVTASPPNASTNSIRVELYGPGSATSSLMACTIGEVGDFSCRLPTLLLDGQYEIRIVPGPRATTFSIGLRSTI